MQDENRKLAVSAGAHFHPALRAAARSVATIVAATSLAACGTDARRPGDDTSTPAAAAAPAAQPELASPAAAPASAVATSTPAADSAALPVKLLLEFTGDTWVQAVVDGQQRISELHIEGEEMRVEAAREIVLTLGNAGAVRATVNGVPHPLPTESGVVVRDLVIRAPAEP